MLSILDKLIRLETTRFHLANQLAALKLIQKYFHDSLSGKIFSFGKIPGVLLTPKKISAPLILLCAHIDVVPGEKSQFCLSHKGDRFIGRGVFDMKGPLVSLMFALKQALRVNPSLSVGLLCTSDEERGGQLGVGSWIQKQRKHMLPKVVIVPDGGNNFDLVVKAKGVMQVNVEVSGRTAHSARPWEGENAIDKAIRGLQKISKIFPKVRGSQIWRTSVSPVSFQAGAVGNQIPGEAKLSFNIRFVDANSPSEIEKKFQKIFIGNRVDTHLYSSAYSISRKEHFIQQFCQTLESIIHRKIISVSYPSSCDARFFVERGIPAIIIRPRGGDAHGPNEWISHKGLETFAKAIQQFLLLH